MRMLLLPAAFLLSCLLAGCGGGSTPSAATSASATPTPAPATPSTPYKTTFVLFGSNFNARQATALLAGARQSAKSHHNSFVVTLHDAPATTESLAKLDPTQTDAVLLFGAAITLQAAKFPIIHFDASSEGNPALPAVATDDALAGQMAAQEIARLLGGKGQVQIAQGSAAPTPRTAAFAAAAAAAGLKISPAADPANPTAAAIYCPDQSATRSTLALAGPKLPPDCKVIGFGLADDLLDALRAGKLQALIVPDYFETGLRAAEAAHDAIVTEGKAPTSQNAQPIPPLLLTKSSLDDPAIQAHLGL